PGVEVPYKELTPFMTTIRQQHEDILKNAQMRQEFTANVSHELKTPLTAISGYAELINHGMASKETAARFAGEIHKNAARLLSLINDIIQLSQLDGGRKQMEFVNLDLLALAEECVDMLALNAQKQNVTMQVLGRKSMVMADKQLMEELVYNLCDNAIRYNNHGGSVTVTVDQENGHTYLLVKDTGIGISKENQERVFERFYRVDKSRSKATGGTGLGLAIVKHIVSQHNATISIESEVGKGTEIRVDFAELTPLTDTIS
ncbi:MAG: ATP-binding protein, partial [Lachnospiraceae bacterium]|nr:ATP-binding protein [Lachnospiraceae bacterium]